MNEMRSSQKRGPARTLWFLCALSVLGPVTGCKRPSASRALGAASTRPAAMIQGPQNFRDRHVLGPGAFDLVRFDGGAALVWASPSSTSLSLTVLDESGAERRSEPALSLDGDAGTAVATPGVAEIAAAARGSELAIAWLERTEGGARARSIVRPITPRGSSSPSIVELGPVLAPLSTPRGNLALTSSTDRFLLLSRGQKSECIEATEHDCVGYGFHRLDRSQATSQNLPLTVPLPCDQNSVSFAVAGSRSYYGVCSRATGRSVTTLFSIQTEPEYARADRILEGCLPLGAISRGSDLLVVGDCEGQRHGVRVRGGNAETSELRVDRLDATCQGGQPVIRQVGSTGLNLTLDSPRDRLEAFLPPYLSPNAARAVWTGQTLLVASTEDNLITLKGYRCDSTLLREVSVGSQ